MKTMKSNKTTYYARILEKSYAIYQRAIKSNK